MRRPKLNSVPRYPQELTKMVKSLVLYDSQTGNTERMAEVVAEGARFIA